MSNLQVSFWLQLAFNSNYKQEVGVMSDPTDTSTFIPVRTIIPTPDDYASFFKHYIVGFANYDGPHGHNAFKAPFQAPVNRPYIDDIVLDVQPCTPIDDLHVVYTTTDSIVIAWIDSSSGSAWYLEYDSIDFTPGTGEVSPIHITNCQLSTIIFLPSPPPPPTTSTSILTASTLSNTTTLKSPH